ncbi:MAG: hypothetical protein B7Z75_07625 [Acidocella sp. 20-57-95]|nr:MAG: hypothetical protein B7Z75_07625 [Acidocella sp. 20-57-95]OYV59542.1 MAG: hypothetical protein B7Z71_07835 [Acidocella sp. 21-58-7]HQT62918.1 cytochrome b/b6 domain-containing protein [Acidocella sp.]HQU05121.1 cytochrome b/b6 domain-containing protein [Acidocella sp.]
MRSRRLGSAGRYDLRTIMLHWLIAFLVAYQFLSAEFWDYFPRPEKHFLIFSHMSLGFLLAIALVLQIIWRLFWGTIAAEASPTRFDRVVKLFHLLLFTLLVCQIPLGFFTRWTDNHPLDVFGLLIPSPLGVCSKATGELVDQIHDINAWIIMGLAGIHAAAALVHHYVLHDNVLRRMLPGTGK